MSTGITIKNIEVTSYSVPTDRPESDGTLKWNATTLVLVRIQAGGREGIGYGYADAATALLIHNKLAPLITGQNALAIPARWQDCAIAIRNLGRPGICSMAISIVDIALWDLKGQLLQQPLITLLGATRDAINAYGSGGFTSYTDAQLAEQLCGWATQGLKRVKMKVGRQPECDVARVAGARRAIGADVELFVDANGAYQRKQALGFAAAFAAYDVRWFEEPVSSDDLPGLHLLRDRGPANMAITAGEYGYSLAYFRRMLEAGAVDTLQADATRCGGITGFLGAAALCQAFSVPLSAHCAPSLHVALCCAAIPAIHLEYFHDHVRIEHLLFDGAPTPIEGRLVAQTERPGLGLTFKSKDAQCFQILQ